MDSQIISMIKDNNKISTETMASVLGTSSKQSRDALNLCLISIMSAEDPMVIGR